MGKSRDPTIEVSKEKNPLIDANYLYDSYLIKEYTGKSVDEVFNEYDLRELIKLNAYLIFIKYI